MKIQETGVLPLLPGLLQPQSSCSTRVANIIAEVAKNGTAGSSSLAHLGPVELRQLLFQVGTLMRLFSPPEFMRSPCVEAGLIPPLIQLLSSSDQEILLQTGRALGNICYDSRKYQRAAPGALPLPLGPGLVRATHAEGLAHANAANIRPVASVRSKVVGVAAFRGSELQRAPSTNVVMSSVVVAMDREYRRRTRANSCEPPIKIPQNAEEEEHFVCCS